MKTLLLLALVALTVVLSGCAAIEEENNSNTPIPPERPNPMGDSFGRSSAGSSTPTF